MKPLSRRETLASTLALSALAVSSRLSLAAKAAQPLSGWREAVLIVPDLASWVDVLTEVGGWQLAWKGAPDSSLNALWSLPKRALTEQVLMRNRMADSGMLRLVVVTGAPQRRIRPYDQAWETGGISALDVRVPDMEATCRAVEARGWDGVADPVRYTAYGKDVSQWVARSPDGIRFSFIQRIAPPLPNAAELTPWGRVTNTAIIVRDLEASRNFFGKVLGMKQISQEKSVGGDGPNVMGMPWNFQRSLKIDICGFKGETPGDGPIELISMVDAQGRDHSANARPPNLGSAALRFIVPDVAAIAAMCKAGGFAPAAPVQAITLPPYGSTKAFAVSGPDGVWLEFIEQAA
jgi:catechol 2,3-dioxygenase-like lactoylglutathione lyase family enzyme